MFSELPGPSGVTFEQMGSPGSRSALAWLALAIVGPAALGLGAGCGSKSSDTKSNALNFDADFSVCATSPKAVRYAPGISVVSTSGTYQAAITAASTDQGSGSPVPTAAIGYDTFTVAVTVVADGGSGSTGSDAGVAAPDGLVMAPPPTSPTYPADPYMPLHGHGASTVPAITAQGGGVFGVANIDFFMAGYWELYLDLTPPGGAADPLTFKICIPSE
jgi:hypothetical protein